MEYDINVKGKKECEVMDGIVYKIYSDEGNMVYIGSTVKTLEERFEYHKMWNNGCNSKYLFKNYKKVKIMELERKQVKDFRELQELELMYMEFYMGIVDVFCVNICNPLTKMYRMPRKRLKELMVENLKNERERRDAQKVLCVYCNVKVSDLKRHSESERHKRFKWNVENGRVMEIRTDFCVCCNMKVDLGHYATKEHARWWDLWMAGKVIHLDLDET